MHAKEQYTPPRGAAAITAIAIQSGLVYLLAVGLGVAPSLPEDALPILVDVPERKRPIPVEFDQRDQNPSTLFTKIKHKVDPPVIEIETAVVLPEKGKPVIGSEPQVQPEIPMKSVRVLFSEEPPYPHASVRSAEEGTVHVRLQIGADGKIAAVQVERSSGFSRLDEAALRAVRSWRFAPATRGGLGVTSWVVVPVVFQLR
jgi:periplasmic protein TonB